MINMLPITAMVDSKQKRIVYLYLTKRTFPVLVKMKV